MERSVGLDHPLVSLVKQCLHNAQEERPGTEELPARLQGVRVEEGDARRSVRPVVRGCQSVHQQQRVCGGFLQYGIRLLSVINIWKSPGAPPKSIKNVGVVVTMPFDMFV